MCGIIGYNGTDSATKCILEGLEKIEYRGYDSAGIATLRSKNMLELTRVVGGVEKLREAIDTSDQAHLGIGHTRWATHGEPSTQNAHPHSSQNFTIVHNGIIENYQELARELTEEKPIRFKSDTDTEVLAWLLESELRETQNVRAAVASALQRVRGTFGVGVIHKQTPNVLYVARRSSPITIAQVPSGYMVASDITALPRDTQHVTHLEDDQFAVITPTSLSVYDLNHDLVKHAKEKLERGGAEADKSGHEHYMIKEILEQPETVAETLRGRLDTTQNTAMLGGLELDEKDARKLREVVSVACGTAHHSSVLASYLLESITDVPLVAHVASEFLYRKRMYEPEETLALAISQSGETADTIAATNKCNLMELRTHGIVNVIGSNLTRVTDGGTYLYTGPEIAVASTKAFTSQVVAQLLVGLKLNSLRGKPKRNNPAAIQALQSLSTDLKATIEATHQSMKRQAKKAAHFEKAMFLGRDSLYPVALEAALKFKEVTYIPSEGHPAGEMKHGPLALVDESMLVVYLAQEGELFEKSISNLREIDARKGATLVLTDSKQLAEEREDAVFVPTTDPLTAPLQFNIALQFLAYYASVERKVNVDKPRNLAKSVTVE